MHFLSQAPQICLHAWPSVFFLFEAPAPGSARIMASQRPPRILRLPLQMTGVADMLFQSFVVVPDDREETPWGHVWVGELNWVPENAVRYWCWRWEPVNLYIPDVLEQLMCETCPDTLVAGGVPPWCPNNVQRAVMRVGKMLRGSRLGYVAEVLSPCNLSC